MKILFLLLLFLALPVVADDAPDNALRVTSCRLAYSYSARDGFLTCAGSNYRTYYPHEAARRARRLPAGARLIIEYVAGPGCGAGCWVRIPRVELPREW